MNGNVNWRPALRASSIHVTKRLYCLAARSGIWREYRADVKQPSRREACQNARYCSSSVASVSSGGGGPPCICFRLRFLRAIGVCAAPRFWSGLRLVAAGRRFARDRFGTCPPLGRRGLEVRTLRRRALFRGGAAFHWLPLFPGRTFGCRAFLRFAIIGSYSGNTLAKKIFPQRGDCELQD